MYKYINKISRSLLVAAVALSGLTACNPVTIDMGDDDEVTTNTGKGQLNLKQLVVDITNTKENAETRSAATRADNGTTQSVEEYTVRVVKASTGQMAYEWLYSEMPEIVTLPVSNYTLESYNAEVPDVAWDTPYYYASQNCAIEADKVVEPQTLVCKLASVKVSIKFSDGLKKLIGSGDDVNINVKLGTKETDFKYTDTGAVYFKNFGTDSTITATFSGTINGTYISELKTVSTVNSGEHHVLNYDVQTVPEPSTRVGMISADGLCLTSSVSVVDLKRNITTEEDVIDANDFLRLSQSTMSLTAEGTGKNINVTASDAWSVTTSDSWLQVSATTTAGGTNIPVAISASENTTTSERKGTITFKMGSMTSQLTVTQAGKSVVQNGPKITSQDETSLKLNTPNQVADVTTAIVNIEAEAGIKSFQVKISSTSQDFATTIAQMADFDLTQPGNLTETLDGLGLPYGDNVTNQKAVEFNISKFIPMLSLFPNATHTFQLIVTDNNGKTSTASIIIVS